MEVRCERCDARYSVDDGLVDEAGLAVRCSKCGNVFRAHRPARGLRVRNRAGDVFPLPDAAVLQRWVVEGRVAREDEVSSEGGPWIKAGDMKDLAPFYAVLDQARRAAAGAAGAPGGPDLVRGGPGVQPIPHHEPTIGAGISESTPSESWEVPAGGPGASNEPAWAAGPPATRPEPARGALRRSASKRGRRSAWPWILLFLVLAGAAAGAVYVSRPAWLPLDALGLGRPASVPQAPATAATPPVAPPQVAPPPAAPPQAAPPPDAPPQATPPPDAPPQDAPPPSRSSESQAQPAAPRSPEEPAANEAGPSPREAATGPVETQPTGPARPQATGPAGAAPPGEPVPGAGATAPGPATPAAPSPAPPVPGGTPATPKAGAFDRPPADAIPGMPAGPVNAPARAAAPGAAADRRAGSAAGRARALLAEARRVRDRGDPEGALDLYGQVLQRDPGSADALAGRGLCYLDLSRYEPAEESFKAALQADPQHGVALMGLAETYRYEGRRADAVTYYQRYLAAHPGGGAAAAARNAVQALEESQ
jgi:predicted Zn finger-like uncharacterized protein